MVTLLQSVPSIQRYSYSFLLTREIEIQSAGGSNGSLIAAQTDRSGKESRGNGKANPQTRAGQENARRNMGHWTGWEHASHGDGLRVAYQTRSHQAGEMPGMKHNLLDAGNRNQR